MSAASRENAPVLEEASVLLVRKCDLEIEKQLLEAFNRHFIISEDESIVLTDLSAPTVDEQFFTVLKRVKQIHTDCQVLLGNENQRLGLELMDQSSRNLNTAYQKLYRWIQREFKTLNLENPRISSIIRRALRVLAERPTLFQSCLDFLGEAREHVLTDAFYSALTGSSTDNQTPRTKPIEFYAHDTLRYIGDMLAWTHSATVSEHEALESLFISDGDEIAKGIQAGRESEPWSVIDDEAFDGRRALDELVNRNLAGVARGIRQRVEQAIQNHENPVLAYKIANLINFYRLTFARLLGPDYSIRETLSALEESAFHQFRTLIKDNVKSIQADLNHPLSTLHVPDFFNEALAQITALLKTYQSALIPASSRAADFQPILTEAFSPYLEACETLAKNVEPPASDIFLLNCYLAAESILSPYDFLVDEISTIKSRMESHISTLVSEQLAFFRHASGLHSLLVALAPYAEPEILPESLLTIPSLPAFRPDSLSAASQKLDAFLPSALMDATENLKDLGSAKLASQITAEAVERLCSDFEFIEGRFAAVDELIDEAEAKEGSEDEEDEEDEERKMQIMPLRALFPRTSGEIRVLLS